MRVEVGRKQHSHTVYIDDELQIPPGDIGVTGSPNYWYPIIRRDGKYIKLHQLVCPGTGKVEYINGNTLDVRAVNLRRRGN